jgi:uncharacterized protein (TIGR03083 family)
MDKQTAWRVIHQERSSLADLLETLTPEEWAHPSLCEGWTVRDVAAHVIGAPETTYRQALSAAVRAGGRYNRTIYEEGKRLSRRPTADIVADFRRLDGSRSLPPFVTHHEALVDILVHTQDIAIPLDRHHEMPREAARDAAARSWRMGFPFGAWRNLRGCRLEATDIDWVAGSGALVRGPVSALLLLVTGRPVALHHLEGDGLPLVRQRLSHDAGEPAHEEGR